MQPVGTGGSEKEPGEVGVPPTLRALPACRDLVRVCGRVCDGEG